MKSFSSLVRRVLHPADVSSFILLGIVGKPGTEELKEAPDDLASVFQRPSPVPLSFCFPHLRASRIL